MLAAKGEMSFLPLCLKDELHTTALNKLHQRMTSGTMANKDDVFRSR